MTLKPLHITTINDSVNYFRASDDLFKITKYLNKNYQFDHIREMLFTKYLSITYTIITWI